MFDLLSKEKYNGKPVVNSDHVLAPTVVIAAQTATLSAMCHIVLLYKRAYGPLP